MSQVHRSMQHREAAARQMHLADTYLRMKDQVIQAGFAWEIDWQNTRSLDHLSEYEFLAESAWVILCSGMRETVVRKCYEAISQAFLDWVSADAVVARRAACEEQALQVFRHRGKIRAVGSVCETVSKCGFRPILQRIKRDGVAFLQTFDFIGPVTSLHLAKNIGLDVVKPDRHLMRMATVSCVSPQELCEMIAEVTGDKLSAIDLVLWRYATLDSDYLNLIQSSFQGR